MPAGPHAMSVQESFHAMPAGPDTAASSRGSRLAAACGLMGLSGFAGLGYQMVWTQQFGIWLGHEIVAVLAVVAAFFGGIAIGAQALGRRIAATAQPARWYAGCEALIGVWGLLLAWALPHANAWLAGLTGAHPSTAWHWSVAFVGPLLLLLPATAAMGATLPAIERVTDRLRADGFAIGALYAANTLGAVAGVLAATFLLVPAVGLANTARICAALNVLCAAGAWWGLRSDRAPSIPTPVAAADAGTAGAGRLRALLFASGALGIGYEVVVVRVLSQLAEDTVYTFALLLAVYLLGTAGGAAFYQARLARSTDAARLLERLVLALATACVAGSLALWPGAWLQATLAGALGEGFVPALARESVLAVAAFALPTVVMGALFSHLCVMARAAGIGFGPAIAVDTLGAALAPAFFGVVLVPWLGPKLVLAAVAGGYLLMLPLRAWRRAPAWIPAGAVAAIAAFGGPLAFVDVPDGGRVVSYVDGVMASVSVVEDEGGVRRLRIDNHQQEGTNASFVGDARQAWLPLLLHPAPRTALFLGLGTGVTASAAAEDPALRVDAVELLPEVIAAAPAFDVAGGDGLARLHVSAGDARRYVRAADARYDVVVADLFHPARSGAGALYTVEHFGAIRARLAPGGLFCQWLPLHQLDLGTLRSIVRAFVTAYPEATALLATNSLDTPVLGLLARPDAPRFSIAQVQARIARFTPAERGARVGLGDAFAVVGSFVAGPTALARFAGDAPLNTDDRPVVAHRAPRITYAPDSLPRERLVTLLHALEPAAGELLDGATDAGWRARVEAYWSARTRFIEVGTGVRLAADPRAMLAQVREPLLDIVRRSPDFRPAYDPLLQMARAIAPVDEAGAADLLAALAAAAPQRPEAAQLRRAIPGGRDPSPVRR